MDIGCILMLLGISILSSMSCKNAAIGMIEEIGINSRYYPKGYIDTSRWIRITFKLKHRLIPKYLYFELVMALVFAAFGPVNSIIYVIGVIANFSLNVAGILMLTHVCLIIINLIFFAIMSTVMKKE